MFVDVEVDEYDKKYRLLSRVYSAPSGEGYHSPAELGPKTPEVSEAETPFEDVPAAERGRESAAQGILVTRQSPLNRELDAQQMSSSSSAAVAIAPEFLMESIVDHGDSMATPQTRIPGSRYGTFREATSCASVDYEESRCLPTSMRRW